MPHTPVIITVAITGSLPRKQNNPAVPVTVSEQIESTHAAFEAGACIAHLHVRNADQTPTSDPDKFAELQAGIKQHCPGMIIQFSTGGRSGKGAERGAMLVHKPDMASLATGSCNFPVTVYENPPALIQSLAAQMREQGVKPEIEVFDLSMLYQAIRLADERVLTAPLHVQFVLGVRNAMPAIRQALAFQVAELHRLMPAATWTGAGIGAHQLEVNRWSLELGGHLRTGLEDNVRWDKASLAPSNAALVRRAAELAAEFGRRPAKVAEARAMLGLRAG